MFQYFLLISSITAVRLRRLTPPPSPSPPIPQIPIGSPPPSPSPPIPQIPIGSPVVVHGKLHGLYLFSGVTRFGSEATDIWSGVCLTPPDIGKNDGSVLGERYFSCPKGQGLFTKPENVRIDDGTMDADAAIQAIDRIGSDTNTNTNPKLNQELKDTQSAIVDGSDSSEGADASADATVSGPESGPVENVMKTISPSQIPVSVASASEYLSALDAKITNIVNRENNEGEQQKIDPVLDATNVENLTNENQQLDTRMQALNEANQGMQQQLGASFSPRPLVMSGVPGTGQQ